MKTKLSYNKKVAQKFIKLSKHGFIVGKGIQEPGKMCIEAALCCAMGLPHSDAPPCVDPDVRSYKIGLNDMPWESNLIRAKAMAPLGLAQLGSDILKKGAFKKLIFCYTQTDIIYPSLDWIPQDKRTAEHEELKEFVKNCFDIQLLLQRQLLLLLQLQQKTSTSFPTVSRHSSKSLN
jgi:hypothetical protein